MLEAQREDAPRAPAPFPVQQYRNAYQQYQTGLLTAGSTDDHAGYQEFEAYVASALQADRGQTLPRIDLANRAIIQVRNGQGQAIADARLVVAGGNGGDLLDVATGTDGRALFLPGSQFGPESQFTVTAYPPDGMAAVTKTFSTQQAVWEITLPNATARLPSALDLALVIDTTGSMSDELAYLKSEIAGIAAAVREQFPQVDQRYSLIVYRDEGDAYVTQTFDFTGSLEEFQRNLDGQWATGGGDYPEAMHLALEQAAGLSWRRQNAARVLFLVADAPPHPQFAARSLQAVERLRGSGVSMFPIAASGVRDEAEYVMRLGAFLTMGQYLFLTDHSGIGNPHAQPHVSQYAVEHLDQLMIRMIAGKLGDGGSASGQPLSAARRTDERALPQAFAQSAAIAGRFNWPRWSVAAAAILAALIVDRSSRARRRAAAAAP